MSERWRNVIAGVVAVAVFASVLVLATRADGREATRATSNDGGAWLVDRDGGRIAHVEYTTRQPTSWATVFTPGLEASALQSDGVLLVHEKTANSLMMIDAPTATLTSTTELPQGATVRARPLGATIFVPETSRLWDLGSAELNGAANLDDVSPRYVGGSPGLVIVGLQGDIAVVTETEIIWPSAADADNPRAVALPEGFSAEHVTMASTRAVAIDGERWFVSTPSGGSEMKLDRPIDVQWVQAESAEWPRVAVVSPAGQAFLVDVSNGSVLELATPDNAAARVSSQPINHEGCVHTLGGDAGALDFWSLCADGRIKPDIARVPAEAQLRLVNGEVWVDALDASGHVMQPDLSLAEIKNFSEVIDDRDEGEESADGDNIEERLDQSSENAGLTEADNLDNDDVNDPPIAEDDEAATRLGRAVVVDVLANDSDPDGDVILVKSVEVLDGADLADVVVPTSANVVQVAPKARAGTVRFRYTITDGNGLSDTAVVAVTILPASQEDNRPPTAVLDRVTGAAGATVTANLLDNDFDEDGDSFALLELADGDGVTVLSAHPDGTVVLQLPSTVDVAQIELKYLIEDEWQAEQEGTLRVILRLDASNSPPDARNDAGTTQVGRTLRLKLLENDVDPDNDLLVIGQKPRLDDDRPINGFMSTSEDGEFLFRPAEAGTYIFTYSATDRRESDTALVRVEVTESQSNRPPVAVRDDVTLALGESRIVRALENDGDPDGDLIAVFETVANPNLNVVSIDGVGFTITMKPSSGVVETFNYAISDGEFRSEFTQVVVNRSQRPFQNAAPVATDDSIRVRAGRTSRLFVLRNDFDPEGMPLTITSAEGPGSESEDGPIAAEVGGNGRWVDVKVPLEQTFPFAVQYSIEDVDGLVDAGSAQVVIVGPDEPNTPPTARPDVAYTVQELPVTINVLSNDSDAESDGLSVIASPSPPTGGSVVPNEGGTGFVYRPAVGFLGTDEFTYLLRDTEGGESVGIVNVAVMPLPVKNRPPIAGDDLELTPFPADGTIATIDVLVNDSDPDGDPLTIVEVSSNDGSAKITESGEFIRYQLPSSVAEEQIVTFTYVIDDSRFGFDDATVELVIQPTVEPLPPIANPDIGGPLAAQETASFDVVANDADPDGDSSLLRLVSISPPTAGSIDDGNITVTAQSESFEVGYTIEDEQGLQASSVLTVEVKENLPPIVQPAVILLGPFNSDEAIPQIDLAQYVSDPDNTLEELTFAGVAGVLGGTTGLVQGARDGRLVTFTTSEDYRGEGGFSFTVQDPAGNLVSGRVSIELLGKSNQPPVGADTSATVEAGKALNFDARSLFTDPDGDDGLVYEIERGPQGPLSLEGSAPDLRLVVPITAGGAEADFAIRVTDPEGETATATVTVVVSETTVGAPVPGSVPVQEINESESAALDVLVVATNTLATGNLTLTSATVITANAGTASVEGRLVNYQSVAGFSGVATIQYVIADEREGDGGEAIGIAEVIVIGRPDTPSGVEAEAVGPNSVIVSWRVPNGNGGPIESYRVRLNGVEIRDHDSTNPQVRFDDLTAGQEYTFEVIATNKAGESTLSTPSTPVTPDERPGPPGTPTAAFVLGTPGAILVRWAASPNRGSDIENYVVEVSGCATGTLPAGTALERVWTDLPDGQNCSFAVKSENKAGESPLSGQSNQECAVAEPAQPAAPSAQRGDKQAQVTWSAPGNPDCEPIQTYEIIRYRNGAVDGSTPVPFGTNNWTSSPLDNGENYSFAVRAQNRQGFGSESTRSPEITPCGVPAAPPAPLVTTGDLQLTVTRQGDAPANGCVVEQYVVRTNGGGPQQLPGNGVITGLTNGADYIFEVAGVNEIGVGEFSPASVAVVPFGPPFAPSDITQNRRQDGFFNHALRDNGSPITSVEFSGPGEVADRRTDYLHVYCVNNLGTRCIIPVNDHGVTPPTACLQNAQLITLEFWAVNAAGAGDRRTEQFNISGCPSAPTLALIEGDGQFIASWSRPVGGNVYIQVDGNYGTPRSGTSNTFSATNGRTYSVTAWACSNFGCSKSATRTVRPAAPSASLTVTRGSRNANQVGSCAPNECKWVLGNGSGFAPNTQYWIQCGNFVDTQTGVPVSYAARSTNAQGELSWGDNICLSSYSHTVRVWNNGGDDVARPIGWPN